VIRLCQIGPDMLRLALSLEPVADSRRVQIAGATYYSHREGGELVSFQLHQAWKSHQHSPVPISSCPNT